MHQFTTPMMKQYQEIKKEYTDCLLFYRMGDFYELFLDDAYQGAKILGITLTSRPKGKDGRIPMAGVPYHAVDGYIAKLVKAGNKVAICEQMTPPSKTGIVERKVIRIITPGTVVDEHALPTKENNYIISLTIAGSICGMSVADISTGYFTLTQLPYTNLAQVLQDELTRINPSECILSQQLYTMPGLLDILHTQTGMNVYPFASWTTYAKKASTILTDHFNVASLETFGIASDLLAIEAGGVLIKYLEYTQKMPVSHIKKITPYVSDESMLLDRATITNLELFTTIRDGGKKDTLLSVIDDTQTAMGARLLREWVKRPLKKKEEILTRQDAVADFISHQKLCAALRELLSGVPDIERILSRLTINIGNARDLIALSHALANINRVKETLSGFSSALLRDMHQQILPVLEDLRVVIDKTILDEPGFDVKEGDIIKPGVDAPLDLLRHVVKGSKNWMSACEKQERERTKIGSLKIRYNKVFGFFIEVSKSNLDNIPPDYIRKQTIVNGERFITPELKHHEEIILSAQEKMRKIEYKIFLDIVEKTKIYSKEIQQAAYCMGVIDCVTNFAHLALRYDYVRPLITDTGDIVIEKGKHPVLERLLPPLSFVPNDIIFDSSHRLLLLTGPNMAGKSVLMRQVALIVLLAQIGCFVPAKNARISVCDRIFVRSGASDVITAGLSTFMVEMVETAYILNNATRNSLIIMDEIGRGTSTYDGISIAWAIAQYLVTYFPSPPKTFFATHYHELQELATTYPEVIKNYHMEVSQEKDALIFLHLLTPGGASHSFGVAVAKLAGIPQEVIERAKTLVTNFEKHHVSSSHEKEVEGGDVSHFGFKIVENELESIDLHNTTPLQALNLLSSLKEKVKLISEKPYQEAIYSK